MDAGDDVDGRQHHASPLCRRRLVHHEPRLGVAGHVRGDTPADEPHDEEGRAQHVRVGLVAEQRWNRRGSRAGDRLHGPVLKLHRDRALRRLGREHAAVGGLDADRVALLAVRAILGPGHLEDHRLVREPGAYRDLDVDDGEAVAQGMGPPHPLLERSPVMAPIRAELGGVGQLARGGAAADLAHRLSLEAAQIGRRIRPIRGAAVARAARERSEQEREWHPCDATGVHLSADALRSDLGLLVEERPLGEAVPFRDAVAELAPRTEDPGEVRVVGGHGVEHVLGLGLERGHHVGRELADLGEPLDGLQVPLVEHVVGRHGVHVGVRRGGLDGGLVLGGQVVPEVEVELHLDRGARLPPSWVVVVQVALELVETEDQVVGRADELSSVDGAGLDRLEDLAAGQRDLLTAEVLQHPSGQTGDTHLQAVEVVDRLELLGEPAAHLAAGRTRGEGDGPVLLRVELVEGLDAPALVQPGVLLALGEAEGHRGAELLDRAEAHVVVGRGVAHLSAAVAHDGKHLEAASDFARGAGVDPEASAG